MCSLIYAYRYIFGKFVCFLPRELYRWYFLVRDENLSEAVEVTVSI
jgi:hypothetical protein